MTTPEEIQRAMMRVRGLETGGGFERTPLTHFRGRLMTIRPNTVTSRRTGRTFQQHVFYFEEVEVIHSIQPYLLPVAEIPMFESNSSTSEEGVLKASVDKILNADLPPDAPEEDEKTLLDLVGLMQEWKITPGHLLWNPRTSKEEPRDCWEVIAVEGQSIPSQTTAGRVQTTNAVERAVELLDGKTEQQWHQVVFNDPIVKADTGPGGVVTQIINRTFLPPLEASGRVTKDEHGIYHLGG